MYHLFFYFIAVAAFVENAAALDWLSSGVLPNGVTVYGCKGHDATLLWNFSLAPKERLHDVEWYFQAKGQSKRLLGTKVAGNFMVSPVAGRNLKFVENAGLHVPSLVPEDAGTYSVHVSVHIDGCVIIKSQNVTLEVSDAPRGLTGQLSAQLMSSAVYSHLTKEWHVNLSCGKLVALGSPPVSIVWTTPSGAILPSSSSHNGVFYLQVPNPVVPGNYTCATDHSSAPGCNAKYLSFRNRATVNVDGVEARVLLLEAGQRAVIGENFELTQRVENLTDQISDLAAENIGLTEMVRTLTEGTDELTLQLHNLTEEFAKLRSENEQLKTGLTNVSKLDSALSKQTIPSCDRPPSDTVASGVYAINISSTYVRVYCDQTTECGGWTVIQRRFDGKTDFYRNWQHYENGFGDADGEYWLGLRYIHALTSQRNHKLRVDLWAFDGATAYAEYSHFSVSGPEDYYRLHVFGYAGTAGDSTGLSYSNKKKFSTYDRDHDDTSENCAERDHGGWWYGNCAYVNLNGYYQKPGGAHVESGMQWYNFKEKTGLKRVEMKIRPV